jgi:predicted Zn-dependent protease
VSHRPDLDYTFTIIDNPEINAFALPAGYVYVNRGLLTFMNSEAELAAVLAHEIGHITARHAVQQQARGGLAKTASTVGGIVTAVATGSGYVGSQISDIASIWAQSGLSGFGREDELEADSPRRRIHR